MDYQDVRAFFGIAGLLIFVTLFLGVLVYTFWPSNKSRFEHASRMPLDDDREDSLSRGENGCA